MRLLFVLLVLLAPTARAQAQTPPPITEAEARAFVAEQEADWNAGRLAAYFGSFSQDATFTDQAYVGAKPPVLYGTSSLDEARTNLRRVFARKPWPREAGRVFRLQPAAGGALMVTTSVGSIVWDGDRPRRLCASRDQVLVRQDGELRATSRIDTFVRCRRPAPN
ncbi:MAG: hypothetical protein U1C74_03045 [Phenylobacterium sp.]|nr:hypothetical protein [Phenylobacterium sp.]